MEALNDMALLREYAEHDSETAFETLVAHWIGFVYAAALRQVGDPHQAEEITQAVFIILAQKAERISDKTILTGWLFKTTRYAALAQKREAIKRSLRTAAIEKEFQMQTESESAAGPLWEQIAPLLDEALASLGEKDRQAILLRFFENKGLAEVGAALNTNDDTAQKRVGRALEKLRKYFSRRGVASSAELISETLSTQPIQAPPASLILTITATAVKGSTAAASTLTLVKGTLKLMAWIKAKMAVIIGATTVIAGTAILTLHAQEEAIREQEQKNRVEEQQIRATLQQPNLPTGQTVQFQTRLRKLQLTQDQLRQQQSQLREKDTNAFARPSLRLSPFTDVQFEGDKVMVNYDGAAYELLDIDDTPTANILDFSRQQYKDLGQKRFAEDLVVVLADMGHPLNTEHTVSLELADPNTGEKKTVEKALMTEQNRQAIMEKRLTSETKAP